MTADTFNTIFFGHYNWATYFSGMFWSLVGAMFVKGWFFPTDSVKGLSWGRRMVFWLNDNSKNVGMVVLWSLVILRAGDEAAHIFEKLLTFELPEIADSVVMTMVISGVTQYFRHKKRKPISEKVQQEMHEHNEHCNH